MKEENRMTTRMTGRSNPALTAAVLCGLLLCFMGQTASAANFHYLQLAGSTFHPINSNLQFAYSGSGCINKTGGTELLVTHKVVLPQGATVKYLRLNAYDASPKKITAFFTTYDAVGGFNERTSVESTDSGGYETFLSPELTYEVDNFVGPTNIVVNLGDENSAELRFCGVRIGYYMPAPTDIIFENGFE